MTEAGAKLDAFLSDAIAELGPKMPETGARASIGSLKDVMAGIKRAADEAALAIAQQGAKMQTEIKNNGDLVVKKMQDEHQDTMQMFGEFLGNERAGDQEKS